MIAGASAEIDVVEVLEILTHLESKAEFVPQVGMEKISAGEVTRLKPSIEEPPTLELKQLPHYLEYAFLEDNSQLPVIIAAGLMSLQKEKLLKTLKAHKRALAWKISDIQGISPSFCTHKILMEDTFKPVV